MNKKLLSIIHAPQFWSWFLGGASGIFLLETFFIGLWALPIVRYSIPYMGVVTKFMIWFAVGYALLFGVGLSLFILVRKFNAASCALGSGSGVVTLFTMLCPVCPLFFLAYFGFSVSITAFATYFWWLRLVAVLLMIGSLVLLWSRIAIDSLPRENGYKIAQYVALVLIGVLLIVNQAAAIHIGRVMTGHDTQAGTSLSGDFAKDVAALVTPTSMPFYGEELGLNMSNLNAINESIRKLGIMAPMQGSNPIQLNDEEMKRYIAIGTEPYVTCEFCCGVKTLVREDGSPTCGCAHSIAMRGTAAYLIRNYPNMTNEEIAYELMRQKGLYFPTQMQERMASSLAGDKNDFLADIKYLTLKLTEKELSNLQQKAKSSGFTPETKAPDMVGGC
ncbi:MAG TPA: hypothetical protein DDW36_00535 [Candidatus Magasanikbacteria bacterium]|nr:hypothetical protein [Candidatus Magasanikbacteria bacterium]